MNDTNDKSLKEFAKGKSQPEVAKLIGVTQPSVSQMLASERNIRVKVLEDGAIEAYEIRPVGKRGLNKAA